MRSSRPTRSRRCRSSTPRRSTSRSTSTASCRPAAWAARRSCRCRWRRCRSSRRRFPDKSFSGIGGISTFEHALNYFLLGCGTVQVCTAAMLDHAIGPNVIKELNAGLARFPREARGQGLDVARRFRRPAPRPRRRAVEDPPAGREGLSRRLRSRRLRRGNGNEEVGIQNLECVHEFQIPTSEFLIAGSLQMIAGAARRASGRSSRPPPPP